MRPVRANPIKIRSSSGQVIRLVSSGVKLRDAIKYRDWFNKVIQIRAQDAHLWLRETIDTQRARLERGENEA